MFISIFDLFKIGIGPSSSHTMGPMVAANRFLDLLAEVKIPVHITCTLYGSLAFTGKGHGTDKAVIYGLLGLQADSFVRQKAELLLETLYQEKEITLPDRPTISFNPEDDLVFDYEDSLPYHPNGLVFEVKDSAGQSVLKKAYYSIGGGFVVSEDETDQPVAVPRNIPYPFKNAKELLSMCADTRQSIADLKRANELAHMPEDQYHRQLHKIWAVMNECIERGLRRDGVLPGGLKVKRRAKDIYDQLLEEKYRNDKSGHFGNEWLTLYAMAVNEQNAAGSRVVTAPTNGAAGVVPAVLRYHLDFGRCDDDAQQDIETYLLTAAAIGGIIKHNASISGAEVGCQGEVGSASAMAAAGLCAVQGGTPAQIENAAEIALEHHLGMTCDPIAGLVQVPCIERNGFGAVKAVTASSLALRGDGTHFVPLDNCIETMRQTGLDMSDRYKETSQGGLAVNLPEC